MLLITLLLIGASFVNAVKSIRHGGSGWNSHSSFNDWKHGPYGGQYSVFNDTTFALEVREFQIL